MKTIAWFDCVPGRDGTFEARFYVRDLRRTIGKPALFQVGISLGVKSGKTITWRNTAPVLQRTIDTVQVPGPPHLPRTLQLINAAPGLSTDTYDPVALVRAVNHLHSLGKEKVLAALREFNGIAEGNPWAVPGAERDPANIDTSDVTCICLIVRLLFEPAWQAGAPPLVASTGFPPPPAQDEKLWPLYPLALQDDLPFLLFPGVACVPAIPPIGELLRWAECNGKLRTRPLRPADNPLVAVDRLCALPQIARLFGGEPRLKPGLTRWYLGLDQQAWRVIQHVVGPWPSSERERCRKDYVTEADWERHKRIAEAFKIRWDEKRQVYVDSVPWYLVVPLTPGANPVF
jgi:hypothetical protein